MKRKSTPRGILLYPEPGCGHEQGCVVLIAWVFRAPDADRARIVMDSGSAERLGIRARETGRLAWVPEPRKRRKP